MQTLTVDELKDANQKFLVQRWTAINRRNIEFKLTFDEWIDIWLTSGHWHERGRKGHEYVMSRIGDKGCYEMGNVKIQTQVQNSNEATGIKRPPRSAEHMRKISEANTGKSGYWKGKKHPQSLIDNYVATRKQQREAKNANTN